MTQPDEELEPEPAATPVELLRRAARASKCRTCGCAHGAVAAVRANVGNDGSALAAAGDALGATLEPETYDCLGCKVCWPAQALTALADEGVIDDSDVDACATQPVEERAGWPPLPGAYTTLRWAAPVAVCTLADGDLAARVVDTATPAISIVGTLATENLGIERLVRNVNANPHLRFVIVCGPEKRQAVGHLPGASLIALSTAGLDPTRRIIGAPGRRPSIHNLASEEVDEFRATVEVVDMTGELDVERIVTVATGLAARTPGPAERFSRGPSVPVSQGRLPARMAPDPAGYFVVYPDVRRKLISLEHYATNGVLDAITDGPTAAHCYMTAIAQKQVSTLDHAAYLGKELARAHHALVTGGRYVQDAAPELAARA